MMDFETAGERSIDPQPRRQPDDRFLLASDDDSMVAALRRGEEAAFERLITLHHMALIRLARVWVSDTSVAEELAQETWLTVF